MIKPGDRVKFISDTEVGVVKEVVGNMAYVSVEEGFDIPAMLSDLMLLDEETEKQIQHKMGYEKPAAPQGRKTKPADAPAPRKSAPHYGKISLAPEYEEDDPLDYAYIKKHAEQNRVQAQQEQRVVKPAPVAPAYKATDYDVKLCFVPVGEGSPETLPLEACLVNDSPYKLFYSIGLWSATSDAVIPLGSGITPDDSKLSLRKFTRDELSKAHRLYITLALFKEVQFVPYPPEQFTLDLSPMKFVRRGAYAENPFFDEPAVVFTLADSKGEAPLKPEKEPPAEKNPEPLYAKDVPPAPAPKKTSGDEVVDLHIDQVLDSTEGLSPEEILQAQTARFALSLDLAVRSGRRGTITYIHGIGTGKLRRRMEKMLEAKYPKIRYENAPFAQYGNGALTIHL